MDKLNKGINQLKDFFTLEDNKIKCDYCSNSYEIILNTEQVIGHLSTHDEYNSDVSSKSSQEDFEKFYRIKNNFIECLYCNEKLCDPWNTRSIVYWHLEVGHQFDEGATNMFWLWIRNNFTLNVATAEQCCKKCNDNIRNKPTYLIKHLRDRHNDAGSLYIPKGLTDNSLDKKLKHEMWHYFTKYEGNARCFFCSVDLQWYNTAAYIPIKDHINKKHKKEKLLDPKKSYTEIQHHLVECDFCETGYDIPFGVCLYLECHLMDVHGFKHNNSIDDTLSNYRSTYCKELGFQKSQCNKCNEVLRETCSLKLTIHLKTCQNLNISPEISLLGRCRNATSSDSMYLGSDINVENIPTSSGHPQAGSSKDSDTEVRDVDHDRDSRKDLKRKSSNPSSPPAGSSCFSDNFDDNDRYSGMKRVKYDNDKGFSDELPSTTDNILDDGDTEGIAASNIHQQSARDEISNISPSNPQNLAAVSNELDPIQDINNEDKFSEIDDQDSDVLDILQI